jgi:hypothetical protein
MKGLRAYKGVVLLVSTKVCAVEEERRAHRRSEYTTTTPAGEWCRLTTTTQLAMHQTHGIRVSIQCEFVSTYMCMC